MRWHLLPMGCLAKAMPLLPPYHSNYDRQTPRADLPARKPLPLQGPLNAGLAGGPQTLNRLTSVWSCVAPLESSARGGQLFRRGVDRLDQRANVIAQGDDLAQRGTGGLREFEALAYAVAPLVDQRNRAGCTHPPRRLAYSVLARNLPRIGMRRPHRPDAQWWR